MNIGNMSVLDFIGLASTVMQFSGGNVSNLQLLQELQAQNQKYLQKILENQDEIIKLLNSPT